MTDKIEKPMPMPNLWRDGWLSEQAPGGGYISWPADNMPDINFNHIDGPLLTMRNGELHWLTLWERIQCALGRTDPLKLEQKYRPHLSDVP